MKTAREFFKICRPSKDNILDSEMNYGIEVLDIIPN